MFFKFVTLATVLTSVAAQFSGFDQMPGIQQFQDVPQPTPEEKFAPANYEFRYGVEDPKTGDRHSQSETRNGDVVKGEYSLMEPDGTIRKVTYTADKQNGFKAVVSRSGQPRSPQYQPPTVVAEQVPVSPSFPPFGRGYHGGLF